MPVQTTYIALLRAVNLAGKKMAPMADLRALAEGLGFTEVRTLLQSGNLVFASDAKGKGAGAKLEAALEAAARARLGLDTDFMVRSAAEWRALAEANPFPDEARSDPAHLVVACLKRPPVAGGLEALRRAIRGPERVEVRGAQAYIVYPDGIGHSKLTAALIDRHLGTPGTGRNWNTVSKLLAAAGG